MTIARVLTGLAVLGFAAVVWAEEAPAPAAPADEPGFVSLFSGTDLAGWDGDPDLWSVKDGAIHGETTPEKPARGNTFLIWRGGTLKDFVLNLRFRIFGGNSGVQYRSKEVSKWVVSGYQAEVGGQTGFLYHERGRGGLANVGDFVILDEGGQKNVFSKVSDAAALRQVPYWKEKEWNDYIIIAQGNYLRHYLNGHPMIALIDRDRVTDPADPKDTRGAAREGVLALQIHAGPPMVVEFKDIRLRTLKADYRQAVLLFDGRALDGWTVSDPKLKDTFAVQGGVIAETGKPPGYLRTEKDYTSYTLHLQLRHVAAGNSGVLVRMQPPDKVWPKSIEAQGQSGHMGDIWNIDKFPMKVDAARTQGRRTVKLHDSNERPLGEWNEYEIALDGGDLQIKVNNLLQNAAAEVEVVPGKIGLQAEGSAKEFRNIVLVPIGGAAEAK